MNKQVKLSGLILEGFRSYVNKTTFKFNSTGLYLISGDNGVGKTTMFAALCWILYKLNINDNANAAVKTFKWMQPKGFLGTRGIVGFTTNDGFKYRVARHLDYTGETCGVEGDSKLMVFKKSVDDKDKFSSKHEVSDELYKADQQEYINRLLGVDSKTFVNSIIFGQRMQRIMSTKDKEKRELFDLLFDMEFIETLKAKCAAKYTETNTAISQVDIKVISSENRVDMLKGRLATAEESITNFDTDKQERLAIIKTEFNEKKAERLQLLEEKEELESAMVTASKSKHKKADPLDAIIEKMDKLREEKSRTADLYASICAATADHLKNEKAAQDKKLMFQDDLKNLKTICPTCGKPMDATGIKKAKKQMESDIATEDYKLINFHMLYTRSKESERVHSSMAEGAKADYDLVCIQYKKIKETNTEQSADQIKVAQLTTKIEVLGEQIEAIRGRHLTEKEKKAPEVDLEDIKDRISKEEAVLVDFKADRLVKQERLARLSWWNSKAFGSAGIKSYVFSAMLEQFNDYINTYTAMFGHKVRFWIDMEKASKPFMVSVYRGENIIDYDDLSGGWKQRIDISAAFAMYDLVGHKTQFNIILFDEIEQNLDAKGMALVTSIIQEKAKTTGVYVISHDDTMDLVGANIITITGGIDTPSIIS